MNEPATIPDSILDRLKEPVAVEHAEVGDEWVPVKFRSQTVALTREETDALGAKPGAMAVRGEVTLRVSEISIGSAGRYATIEIFPKIEVKEVRGVASLYEKRFLKIE